MQKSAAGGVALRVEGNMTWIKISVEWVAVINFRSCVKEGLRQRDMADECRRVEVAKLLHSHSHLTQSFRVLARDHLKSHRQHPGCYSLGCCHQPSSPFVVDDYKETCRIIP